MSDTTELASREGQAVARRDGDQAARTPALVPSVDVFENNLGITLYADLPGVSKDELDVKVHDGNLSIEAQAMVPTPAVMRVGHVEVREPRFARSFALSPELDASKIEAELRDGVLKLSIPRREEARPRRIEIKAS